MKTRVIGTGLLAVLLTAGYGPAAPMAMAQSGAPAPAQGPASPTAPGRSLMTNEMMKTDAQWRQELTAEQYQVLRQKGTERAFTGKYWNHHAPGSYRCAGCGQEVFRSDTKFESGCGWPSFYAPLSANAVQTQADNSHLMHRTEVLCSRCGGHLGHIFTDGPQPTGLRYCINSASLKFEPKAKTNAPPH